ncbi:hypothetical protein C8R46DRAFT_1278623 [Mycena filopes]|nr:hypothetical protein C8R46DRAFT_1278623 [Mycena filopes]
MPMHINPLTGRYHYVHRSSQSDVRHSPYSSSRPSAVPTRQRGIELRAHDPAPAVLQRCHLEIVAARQAGKILTWSPAATGLTGLDDWYRPVRTSKSGSMRLLAASQFQFTTGINLPRCPHAANPFRTIEETTQECKRIGNRWVFRTTSHECEFSTEIPPITSSQVLLTENELTDYLNTQDYLDLDGDAHDTEDEEFDTSAVIGSSDWKTPIRASSEQRVAAYLSSSPSWDSIASDPSSSPFPRVLSSTGSSSSSPTRPTPSPRRGADIKPYFSPIVSAQRSCPDYELITMMLELEDNGFYKMNPEEHPAYSAMTRTPAILLPYHPTTARGRLADKMHNMTLPYGRVICDFMSTVGISREALFHLCSQSLLCAGCACWYSIEGYHTHRALAATGYVCTGSQDLPMIPSRHPPMESVPSLRFRTYPSGATIPIRQDFLDSTIGRAFVDWNSRVGIPQDVWTMITTAYRSRAAKLPREGEGSGGGSVPEK